MSLFEVFLSHPLIPLFIIANLAIGYWAHRQAKVGSFDDYATASGSLPTGVLIMTILATLVAAGDFAIIERTAIFGIIVPILYFVTFAIID